MHFWKNSRLAICLLTLTGGFPSLSIAQVNNAGSPIVFSGGNSINTGTLSSMIDNPVQVLGTGGNLIGSNSVTFLDPFTGPGVLTLNLGSSTTVQFGYEYYPTSSVATFTNGFTLQQGEMNFHNGTTIINGDFSVIGNSRIQGDAFFTSNIISGVSEKTLTVVNGTVTFAGSGFVFNSAISEVYTANSSGNQTFGGNVGGNVWRMKNGGTSTFSSNVGTIYAYGGTVVLNGSNGRASAGLGPAVYLGCGSLILDNTLVNNNARVSGNIINYGGDISLFGVNGGVTIQNFPAPSFSEGLIRILVGSGSGAGSSATLNFGGTATSAMGKSSVDFRGLNSTSKIFFAGQSAGPIGAWSTVDGAEFAAYDTLNGVQTLSPAGRPTQINLGTTGAYVIGSEPQAALSANVTLDGVTMNTGADLNLGGNIMTLGGWIQNGGSGVISNGTLNGYYIHFTTNTDLSLTTRVTAQVLFKNGIGKLILNGNYGNSYSQFYVNTGTMELNLNVPLASSQGQSTFVIGQTAGAAGSATLNLIAANQFISNQSNPYNYVGVQVQAAGQFNLNGHDTTVSFLQVNGGVVDAGGATIKAGRVMAYDASATGQIKNGTLQIEQNNGRFDIYSRIYQDDLSVSSRIVSSDSIEKTGTGTLVLSNASNSYGNGTVGLILAGGTVTLTNSGSVGSANQEIRFNGGGLKADSSGVLVLTNPVTGGVVVTSGTEMVFSGGYTQTDYNGQIHVSNTLTVNGYAIYGSNYYSSKTGYGTLILGGIASGATSGTFTHRCGTLRLDSNVPLPSGMILQYEGGTIEAATSARTVPNKIIISKDITFSGSQSLTFSAVSGNSVDPNQGIVNRKFYVNGSGPVIINNLTNGQSSTLTKAGQGTLVVSGNPSGFAASQINEGILRVKSANATGASIGAIGVNNQGIFGGTGIVKGLTTVANGGNIDPGDSAQTVGSLNFKAGLTLTSGAVLNFDLGATSGNDLIQITGGTFSAPNIGTCTINICNSGDFGPGIYTLISWSNTSTVSESSFSIGNKIQGYRYIFFISGKSLCLAVVQESISDLAAFRFVNGLAADGTQDLLTPAGDGVSNLRKYAFNMIGTNPGQATSLAIPNTTPVGPTGTAGLPAWNLETNVVLTITYVRRKTASSPGITYVVEFSDDLFSWDANPLANENVTSIDSVFERVTLTDSEARKSRRFGRIRIFAQ